MHDVEHAALGLAVAVPEGWTAVFDGSGILATRPLDPDDAVLPPCVALTLEPLDGEWTAEALSEQGLLHEARVLTDLRLVDEGAAELCGLEAHRTLCAFRQGVSSLTLEQWHAIHPRGALALTATGPTASYAALGEVWRGMLKSARVDG